MRVYALLLLLAPAGVAIAGYCAAVWGAPALGAPAALNAAGMIACVGGAALAGASVWRNRAMRRH